MPENNPTPITDAELAELDRLFGRRRECNKDATKWAQSISICYRPLRQRLLDAEARLEAAERERDHWKHRTQLCSAEVIYLEEQAAKRLREAK